MTTQEAYDGIKAYFSQPDAVFGFDTQSQKCMYRGPQGQKCAIGCLIPDDQYDSSWDLGGGLGAYEVVPEVNALNEVDLNFLESAQETHDEYAKPDKWHEASGKSTREALDLFLTNLSNLALNYELEA